VEKQKKSIAEMQCCCLRQVNGGAGEEKRTELNGTALNGTELN
jgi:hypothetical protein